MILTYIFFYKESAVMHLAILLTLFMGNSWLGNSDINMQTSVFTWKHQYSLGNMKISLETTIYLGTLFWTWDHFWLTAEGWPQPYALTKWILFPSYVSKLTINYFCLNSVNSQPLIQITKFFSLLFRFRTRFDDKKNFTLTII